MKNKHAFKTISLLFICSLLGAGCAFFTQAILARRLGPVEFGAFSTALAMVTLVMPFAGFGIAQFWLKAFGQEGWRATQFLAPSFRFVGMSSVVVILALIVWSIFGPHDESLKVMIFVLSSYIVGQVTVELVSSKLQLEERYTYLALWQFLPHLSRLGLVVALVFWRADLISGKNTAYAYAMVAVGLVFLGGISLYRMSNGHFKLKGHGEASLNLNLTKPNIRTVIAQSWPFGLAGLFQLIYFQSDIILVKYITGEEAAGIYNVAFTIMMAVLIFPGIVYQKFLLPKIHRWANHDRERFYQVYRQGNIIMLILGIAAMLFIWVIAPWGVPFVFGKAYQDAINLLKVLAVSAPIMFVASSVGPTLVTQEHMKKKVKYMGTVAVINIVLNISLIPTFGALGAAIATNLSNMMLLTIFFVAAQKLVFSTESKRYINIK